MFDEATRLRAQQWLDELYSYGDKALERERYLGALSMLESLGISWKRSAEGVHTLMLHVLHDNQGDRVICNDQGD